MKDEGFSKEESEEKLTQVNYLNIDWKVALKNSKLAKILLTQVNYLNIDWKVPVIVTKLLSINLHK